jgi:IS5 family transposase
MTDDFFRSRLDQMIDLRHPLAVLAQRLPWSQIEAALAPSFARKDREGKAVAGDDLFGTTLEIAGARLWHHHLACNRPTEIGSKCAV